MNTPILIACIIAAAVLLLLCAMFFRPVKKLFFLFLHTVFGWLGLTFFNTLCAATSFSIGVNLASATIAGVLGLPGVLMMTAVKLLYHV